MPAWGGESAGLDFGRGGVRRLGDWVVRPYRRGGLVRHLNGRVYADPGRFGAELAVHRALYEAGFPTVAPLGYAFRRRLWGVEGLYATRFEASTPWPRAWERTPELMPELGRMLRALAGAGVWAPDLNATNVLLRPDGSVLALDWDRARAGVPPEGLLERYAERLRRSLRKLGAPAGVSSALEAALAASPGSSSGPKAPE